MLKSGDNHTSTNEKFEYIYPLSKGVLTPTLQPVCNWFATRIKTEIAERLQRSRKGFLQVANQSPIEISREMSFEHAKKTGRD